MSNDRKDFFISYNLNDFIWAEFINQQLKEAGYSTVMDREFFIPGSNFMSDIDKSIESCQHIILVLSPDYINSPYTQAESLSKDPSGESGIIIPVMVRKSNLQGLLLYRQYIDLTTMSLDEAGVYLISEIKRALEKVKPVHLIANEQSTYQKDNKKETIHNLSGRNPYFTGREAILDNIRQVLEKQNASSFCPQVIYGLGGVGKTQLALEYAHRYLDDYQLVWWIRAEELSTLYDDFSALADKIDIEGQNSCDKKSIQIAVRSWLGNNSSWLLVFDNAEQPEDIKGLLPVNSQGHIIVTSRQSDWHGWAEMIPLEALDREESVNFLLQRTGLVDRKSANELSEMLGNQPLALELASSYIIQTGSAIDIYLEQFQNYRLEMLCGGTVLNNNGNLLNAFGFIIDRLKSENGAAIQLFNLCAFLAPERIPLSMLSEYKSLENRFNTLSNIGSTFDFDSALHFLEKYSLVRVDGAYLSIPRKAQSLARKRLNEEEVLEQLENTLDMLDDTFNYVYDDTDTWSACTEVFPHILAFERYSGEKGYSSERFVRLLNKTGYYVGSKRMDYVLAKNILEKALKLYKDSYSLSVQSTTYTYLGRTLQSMGRHGDARVMFESALNIVIDISGEESKDVAFAYQDLANINQKTGEYEKSRDYYSKALTIKEKVFGIEHPSTAITYHGIGNLHQNMDEYEEARDYYSKALAIDLKVYGSEHPSTAITYHEMGNLHQKIGDYDKARDYYLKALVIKERVYGSEHPSTAVTYHEIGRLHQNMGEYEKAREYYFKALVIEEKVNGSEHPSTAVTYHEIGNLHKKTGEYEKARDYYFKALAIKEKVYGIEHPSTAITYHEIGRLHQNMGEYEKAREYYFKVLAFYEKVYGIEHSSTATTYHEVGRLHQNMGEYEKAREYYFKALAIEEKVYGIEHISTAITYHEIGKLHRNMGKYEKARDYYFKALAINEKVYGIEHSSTATTYHEIGNLHQNMGEYEKAREYYFKVRVIREKVYGIEHSSTATTYHEIGRLYYNLGDFIQAKLYFEKCHAIYKKIYSENRINVSTTTYYLAKIHLVYGRLVEAEGLFNRFLLIKQMVGAEHWRVAYGYIKLAQISLLKDDLLEAENHCIKALAIDEKVYGNNHHCVARDKHMLGLVYLNMGKPGEARRLLEEAFAIDKKTFGEKHDNVARDLTSLGMVYLTEDNEESARESWERALSINEGALGVSHHKTGRVLLYLASLLGDTSHREEAIKYFRRATEIFRMTFGEDHQLYRRSIEGLSRLEGSCEQSTV